MRLNVNGQDAEIISLADVQPYWDAVRRQQFAEVWLDAGDDGPALMILVNSQHALLVYLPDHDGDSSFTSRNPHYVGPSEALKEFMLGNGQFDQYPAAWALPLEQALRACEYFVATHGDRSPDVAWHTERD